MKLCFASSQNCYYYGLINEEIRTRKGTPLFFHTNINILHDGYRADILIKKDKKNRNLNLLKKMISLEPSNIRWRYFYLKEGFNNLSLKEIEEVVNTFLVKNETCDLIYENVDVNNYTFFKLNYFVESIYKIINIWRLRNVQKSWNQ